MRKHLHYLSPPKQSGHQFYPSYEMNFLSYGIPQYQEMELKQEQASNQRLLTLTFFEKTVCIDDGLSHISAICRQSCQLIDSPLIRKDSHPLATVQVEALYGLIDLQYGTYLITIVRSTEVGVLIDGIIRHVQELSFYKVSLNDVHSGSDEHYIIGLKQLLQEQLFYCTGRDITQRTAALLGDQPEENHYWFNHHQSQRLIKQPQLLAKCILGMVRYSKNDGVELLFVSRTDRRRLGRRWHCRGADEEGHTANTVQTEQIIVSKKSQKTTVMSYVHLRGSMPFGWSSYPSLKWAPTQVLQNDQQQRLQELKNHFNELERSYGTVTIVNLIRHSKIEGRLDHEYVKLVAKYNDERQQQNPKAGKMRYVGFDFNKECGGGKFYRIVELLKQIEEELNTSGLGQYQSQDGKLFQQVSRQQVLLRMNCIDCVDRTNCAQFAVAKIIHHAMLAALAGQSPRILTDNFSKELPAFDNTFLRDAWRDNAKQIAHFYVGTDGMKADYVHTGKWPLSGMIRDGYASIKRYWLGNFYDSRTQDFMDILTGKLNPKEQPFKHCIINSGQVFLLSVITAPFAGNYFYRFLKESPSAIQTENTSVTLSILELVVVGLLSVYIVFKMFQANTGKSLRKSVLRESQLKHPHRQEDDIEKNMKTE